MIKVMVKGKDKATDQVESVVMSDLVPEEHLLRQISRVLDFSFIYELVVDKYSPDKGRPGIDPVVLIKIVLIQFLFGIRSMRQTCKEIEVNAAYRWFLGMGWQDKTPHFTTFGKNYSRRFAGTDLFEQIFSHILAKCYAAGYVKGGEVFVDATHIKASANRNKRIRAAAKKDAAAYEQELLEEINKEREALGKDTSTNREGRRVYRSRSKPCKNCPNLSRCTNSIVEPLQNPYGSWRIFFVGQGRRRRLARASQRGERSSPEKRPRRRVGFGVVRLYNTNPHLKHHQTER
jgi:transposase